MTLPWYPRDMGKYSRDTGTLSLAQHGAYNLLIDHYYSTGPINAFEQCSSNAQLMPDHSGLYRLCKAATKQEQEAVDFVLKRYFRLDDAGFYRHDKCDEVIEIQSKKHENRVRVGRENRKKFLLKQCSSNAVQTQTKNLRKTPPLPPSGGDELFERGGKGKERKTRQITPDDRSGASGVVSGTSVAKRPKNSPTGLKFDIDQILSDGDRIEAKAEAPGWDQQWLMREYNERVNSGEFQVPTYPGRAYIAWAKSFTKGKRPT